MRWNASAAMLTLTSQELYLYIDQNAPVLYTPASPEFSTNLDADLLGNYGWLISNNSTFTWTNVSLFFFLDAEWDFETNLVSNEYAEFLGLGLPSGAPSGALAPNGWEIDEPGYVFGDIYNNVSAGATVDNFNAVPGSSPDDVSLAFRWNLPSLGAGESMRLTILHQSAATEGIAHFDPDSIASFYVNGYLEPIPAQGGGNEVPEPGGATAVAAGLALLAYIARKKGQ